MLGISRADIRRHFEAIVEFAEVTGFVETPLKHYSHGMSMRLAFSIAVHLDGEILLVDEMLEGGDASFQQKCRRKMHELSGDGRTVLFISHNMHAVAAVCSRAIVLDRGERVFDGPAAEGIRFYLDHNLTDASLSWDVDACQRGGRDAGSVVRLSRIRATATDSGGFRFMEPLRFRIEITAHAALDRVACAMALDDVYGSRVVTFDSSDQQMGVAGGGRYAVDVTIPGFGLLPGKYLLSANVHSGSQCHDDLRHFGALTVASVGEDGAADVEEYTDRGGIVVASQWRFSQLSAQVLQ
jgi:lipopolysaccharide transport system ATP-binding protein